MARPMVCWPCGVCCHQHLARLTLLSHRAFRALRPLRSINKIPQLRLIVNTLLAAIPQLLHVMLLSAMIYCVLGLAALQVSFLRDTCCSL